MIWNGPQFGNLRSEKFVRLDFWLLFVTKNGILRFSVFGLIKNDYESKIANETTHNFGVADQKIISDKIFDPFL